MGTMNDLQFIQLLKRTFFDFFFIRKDGKSASVLNLIELVEIYKENIKKEAIKEYQETLKTKLYEHNINEK
jgi:hypothetical protein